MMLRIIFILSCTFYTVSSVCNNSWVRYENWCYYFAHHPTERVVWNTAVQACARKGSHLVIVETKGEHEFIRDHLVALSPEYNDQFWTFGNDIFTENEWNWGETPNSTLELASITPTFWGPGEPNDIHGGEDCLAYYTKLHFAWNDEVCHQPEYFICEVLDYVGGGIIG